MSNEPRKNPVDSFFDFLGKIAEFLFSPFNYALEEERKGNMGAGCFLMIGLFILTAMFAGC